SIARFAERALHDVDAARDISQETFIRLWNARGDFAHTPELVRPFLYRTARNLVLDEVRKRSVRARAAALGLGVERHDFGPAEQFDADTVGSAIAAAIDLLTPRRRDAFVLAYLHDL